jgi:mRNA interferase HicA
MKRKKLVQHMRAQGCEQLREGGRHSWWQNLRQNKRSAVPRHHEISDILAKKICKDLGIDPPQSTS